MESWSGQVWQIAAGDATHAYSDWFIKYGVALIGPGWPGPWTHDSEDEEFEGGYVRRFASEVTVGDAIVLRRGVASILAIGLVESEYFFEEAFEDVHGWSLQHARRVRWACLPSERRFRNAVFGTRPSRFSRVRNKNVVRFASRCVNSPQTSWQPVPLPSLPPKEPRLEEIPPGLGQLVAQAKRLHSLYWDWDRFDEGPPNESEMIAHFVVPFIRALGWSVEQIALGWHHVDVAVFHSLPRLPENCRFVIEAKRLGRGIESARAQARSYVEKLGAPCDVVVTDGMRYRLYARDKDFNEAGYADLSNPKRLAARLFAYMSNAGNR